jgi:hypothetical protein
VRSRRFLWLALMLGVLFVLVLGACLGILLGIMLN